MKKPGLFSWLLLAAFFSASFHTAAYADYIVQPGVVIGNSGIGPGPGGGTAGGTGSDTSPEAVPAEPGTDGAPGSETDTGSETNSEDAVWAAPGVVIDPSVTWEPLPDEMTPGNGASSGETAAGAEGNLDPVTESISKPNTLIATEDSNLFYLNGRLVDKTKPSVALTYDDGPHPAVGNRIMDLMESYGSRCTFFLVGNRVPSRASEVQRMAAEGFEIGNHTYEHKYLDSLGASAIQSQVSGCNSTIEQYAGVTPALMRLPGGNKNSTVLSNVDMPIILWNIDTRDWSTRNAASTIAAVVGRVKDGDIVLMHELYSSTATASETIIPTLIDEGFQLLTVSELASLKGVTLEAGHVYYSF